MDELVQMLRRLGFAEYEAKAYIALLRRSPLTGYELAKASGVPRADIYSVLQRLEDRVAVFRLDTESGSRYAPVPPEDVLHRLEASFLRDLGAASRSLQEIGAEPEYQQVWNLKSSKGVREHARQLLAGARRELTVALPHTEAEALADELEAAEERGVAITTLCLDACPQVCDNCRGEIHRYRAEPQTGSSWMLIIRDNSEVLIAEVVSNEEATAVRTRQKLMVELALWHVRHSIALASILSDPNVQLTELLLPETRRAVEALGQGENQKGWLDEMLRLLAVTPPTGEG